MSLISSAPFSNVTVYRKDYYKKSCPRPLKYHPVQEYADPIGGPMEEHVLPNFKYKNLPESQTEYPDPKEYAEHVAEKFPSTRIYLRDCPGGPPDLDVIDKFYQDDNRTVYMVSYCARGDYESKTSRVNLRQSLPEGWIIPQTTQSGSYRNPKLMSPGGVSKIPRRVPKDNLSPNRRFTIIMTREKVRDILQVKTGESIYISDISNTGTEIIEGKLHGDVNIRPTFEEDDLLRAMLIRTD